MMSKRGFTLIELIIVITIMAILMAFATPALIQWRESAQVKEVARDILGGLRQARSIAVTENRPVDVAIDTDDHTLVYDGTTKSFPQTIVLEVSGGGSEPDPTVTFSSQGAASDLIEIKVAGNDTLIVTIDSTASGLAKIK
jgi:prepilin-type N-terminal cleavage/methylation domain-containing protein